ncbi:MAG: hypothetical protein IMY72_00925 [Bacteroidetes bacterium]|nr:hypothetical protein [Bacteroidota bacterium]
MKKKKALLFAIAISLLSMFIWLFEIKVIIGWYDTNWLKTIHYSPILISFLIAVSFLFPIWISREIKLKKIIETLIIFSLINYLFYLSTWIIMAISLIILYGFASFVPSSFYFYITFLSLLMIWLIWAYLGLILYEFTCERKKLLVLSKSNFRNLYLLILSVLPLSMISVKIFSFGDPHHFYELPICSAKMGYPIFWISIILGFYSIGYTYKKEQL